MPETGKNQNSGVMLRIQLKFWWMIPMGGRYNPSNSAICPRNSRKMAKNGPNWAQHLSQRPKTKNGPYLGLRGSKPNSEGT